MIEPTGYRGWTRKYYSPGKTQFAEYPVVQYDHGADVCVSANMFGVRVEADRIFSGQDVADLMRVIHCARQQHEALKETGEPLMQDVCEANAMASIRNVVFKVVPSGDPA